MHPQLQMLVALQDMEQMIREAEDQKKASELEDMGFDLSGLEKVKAAAEELGAKIDQRHMSYYRRLTKRYGHAVVPVVSNLCTGCFAQIPASFVSVTNENKVQKCENCGRILYWP
jgi:predicted  nucleic acid-binding Zn-ribbon protein